MAYIVNQYNNNNSFIFMKPLINGEPIRVSEQSDVGVISSQSISPFVDEAIKIEGLKASKHYYFHGKVKRLAEPQTFYIYLRNQDDKDVNADDQYIKTITIQGGEGWSDFEFVFTPLSAFDTMLFKLKRTAMDYVPDTCRYPLFVYQELSEIKNLLEELGVVRNSDGVFLGGAYKIGVQTRPGFMMCINGEEIHTGKSGVYEIRNGFITVDFFSAISGLKIDKDSQSDFDIFLEELKQGTDPAETNSKCLFNSNEFSMFREIDKFTLDYVYEGGQ